MDIRENKWLRPVYGNVFSLKWQRSKGLGGRIARTVAKDLIGLVNPKNRRQVSFVLELLLYNAWQAWWFQKAFPGYEIVVKYSRHIEFYGRKGRYGLEHQSHSATMKVIDEMAKGGYIGTRTMGPGSSYRSFFWPEEKLAALFQDCSEPARPGDFRPPLEDMVRDVESDVVVLKDERKELMDYEDDAFTRSVRRSIRKLNETLRNHRITLELTFDDVATIELSADLDSSSGLFCYTGTTTTPPPAPTQPSGLLVEHLEPERLESSSSSESPSASEPETTPSMPPVTEDWPRCETWLTQILKHDAQSEVARPLGYSTLVVDGVVIISVPVGTPRPQSILSLMAAEEDSSVRASERDLSDAAQYTSSVSTSLSSISLSHHQSNPIAPSSQSRIPAHSCTSSPLPPYPTPSSPNTGKDKSPIVGNISLSSREIAYLNVLAKTLSTSTSRVGQIILNSASYWEAFHRIKLEQWRGEIYLGEYSPGQVIKAFQEKHRVIKKWLFSFFREQSLWSGMSCTAVTISGS